ncbi:structural protein [Cellulophaga phage phi12:1]|uniref:Structural protein n=2 Tax=Cellulophaga phage phi12:1 TaxID=1327976 RepID=R9ZXP1_9CAUD|nr:virion structural protein [Cellulophaga phage phi12:1]AGO48024.1 structural protein [Cellulophaga phage phi12:1]AGO48189.1 structural protein [Cellulophaga phage phi12:3]
MAYIEKYYHNYCDSFGTACKVSILERDYEGSAIELEAQFPPFKKTYDSDSDFKFEPIRSTSGEFNIVFGTGNGIDLSDIETADERQYKMIHYVDGSVDWIGYVVPDGFSHELRGGIYFGSLIATDGLKQLQSLPFVDISGDNYGLQDLTYNNGYEFPFSLVLTEILRKLDLDLNTWTAVDVYEKNMTQLGNSRDSDPLSQAYVNVKTYINDTTRKDIPYWADAQEAMNCFEVLNNMCTLFGARVSQNKGVWTFKRVNIDANYGSGDTQRYWRKYNTLSVYLGREAINDTVNIPCSDIDEVLIGTDHQISISDVYAAYRMNYKFQLVREGDTPLNLLTNGNFSVFNNTSPFAAPQDWFLWSEGTRWVPRISPVTLSPTDAGGITTAVEFGTLTPGLSTNNTDPVGQVWASLRYYENKSVNEGDALYFTAWAKFGFNNATNPENVYAPFLRCVIVGASGKKYYLANNLSDEPLKWINNDDFDTAKDDLFFVLLYGFAVGAPESSDISSEFGVYGWKEFALTLPEIPEDGLLTFDVHGLAKFEGKATNSFAKIKLNEQKSNKFIYWYPVREGNYDNGVGRLQITGLSLGTIPDPNENAEAQDYVYYNQNKNYSLEVDPVEVLNGDILDQNHVSRIIVPSNTTGNKNFWDTIDNKYGGASLGLITVKSIMNLYFKPFQLLEGDLKSQFGNADTVYTFEAIPGKSFCLLRGTFIQKNNYIEGATFFEITSEDIPAGGTEGGNSLDAEYVLTGRKRCQKVDNLNTGLAEVELDDVNINSETYGQTIWETSAVLGLTLCPIGEPDKYYWGTDSAVYDSSTFDSVGFYEEDGGDEVSCEFTNPGGEYVYFLHLASLGLVESIETEAQDEIISDFQYLTDVTINSYLYRVLRQNYVTSVFNDIQITFKFS